MPTIKEIKNRRNSIQSTSQITKAMKLVSTVKLQRTKEAAQNALPYFDTMYKTVTQILSKSMNLNHKYITPNNKNGKVALVVISSNRGLAGGYNSNIIRKIIGNDKVFDFDKNTTLIYSIGSKARDQLKMKGFTIEKDYSDIIENNNYSLYTMIANDLLSDFSNGKIKEIYIAFTLFKNTVVHIPIVMKLLPITDLDLKKEEQDTDLINMKIGFDIYKSKYANDDISIMNYEPNDEQLLDLLIPKYISAELFGAHTSSIASENGARMTAMDNATNNANELIDKLSIQYNRARQGAITQELTEIIAGANAI